MNEYTLFICLPINPKYVREHENKQNYTISFPKTPIPSINRFNDGIDF
jgi:hypothetical protein